MPTTEEYLRQTVELRLRRLADTADELESAISGQNAAALSKRPAAGKWSAKEVLCHLRDIEELYILRFHTMLAMEDPRVFVAAAPPDDPERWGINEQVPFPVDPDRWAEERQYQRTDAGLALRAFRRRRGEVLTLLRGLSSDKWKRGCIVPGKRRVTFEDWTASMAAHDDKHVAQLRRALDGTNH